MAIRSPSAPHPTAPDALRTLVTSWRRSLAARRISPRTIATYATSVDQLAAFLADRAMPTAVGGIRREHVESFVADLLTRKPPRLPEAPPPVLRDPELRKLLGACARDES